MNPLAAILALAGTFTAAVIAVTLELVPERLHLAGLVLTSAGLGSLSGIAYGTIRRVTSARRASYAERGSLFGAGAAVVLFAVLFAV